MASILVRSRLYAFVTLLLAFFGWQVGEARAQGCDAPVNAIVAENCQPGAPATEWDVSLDGSPNLQGFTTDISVNRGGTVHFKVNTVATAFHVDVYRLGYYQGSGARKVATIADADTVKTSQPACVNDAATGLVDCGNWTESASWAVPANATSGIYIARLVRDDAGGPGEASHIAFVVRDDASTSKLFFQASDTTWQAYNPWGDDLVGPDGLPSPRRNSLYVASPGQGAYSHASKVSYNRPFSTRAGGGGGWAAEDWLFNSEYPMIRWLEANGYDVSYTTDTDSDRRGSLILNHKVFLSVGHDEYWSRAQRDAVEAARDAGVHLAFFSGNEIYWKTRWENSPLERGEPYRTLVCYKEGTPGQLEAELACGSKCDPVQTVWTGLWRAGCEYPDADGCRPENALSGQISWNGTTGTISVPDTFKNDRFWRNTAVADLAPGQSSSLTQGTLGYEWNPEQPQYAAYYPPGRVLLSSTDVATNVGSLTHHLSLYRHSRGALVFGAGTVQWSWGLDSNHDRGSQETSPAMQQATVNLLADMGVSATTLQQGLTQTSGPTDTTGPTAAITSPSDGGIVSRGSVVTVTGTAFDGSGSVVAVEVSTDNGATWHAATGTANWTYAWLPMGDAATLLARATDDSYNLGPASMPVDVTVGDPPPPTGPVSIWNGTGTPAIDAAKDNADPIETGVKFRSSLAGYITAIRFYKGADQTATHTGNLWSSGGVLLGTATFTETASGWQEGLLDTPVAIDADTTYVASVYSAAGYYAYTDAFFALPVSNWPLTALATSDLDGPNGVYKYGGGFPTSPASASNYWVDVVYQPSVGPDTTPPTVVSNLPTVGAPNVAPGASVSATFSEAVKAATVTGTTFELRDDQAVLVPATVSYDAPNHRAVLTPSSPLAYNKAYTATVKGGSGGVTDLSGNPLASDYIWSFTVQEPPPAPPQEGPGGPILVIGHTANPFTRYFAEILRTEGLNAFKAVDISEVDANLLAGYDVAILGEMPLTTGQLDLLTTWVNAGGNLIAMKPDAQLAGLLGLTPGSGTRANQYLAVNTTVAPGQGIVADTIQFHGTADNWTASSGTSVLATLYSSAVQSTSNPAVTLRSVGTNGGHAAAFTFDLARSIVYSRQGNPAWVGQKRDGQIQPIRSDDLYFGAATADPQPDWVDLTKVAIPQADELQRLLANMILKMNEDRKPLPRFWYLPKGKKAAVLETGDEHGCCGGTRSRFERYEALSAPGCSVADWDCIRASSYVYINDTMTLGEAQTWTANGFEIGLHLNTGCATYTPESVTPMFTVQLAAFDQQLPGLPRQASHRTHCISWSGWTTKAEKEKQFGIRLDTNYYYWPQAWVQNRPGFFTGSGMPMRFAQLDGSMVDVYQAATQIPDESGLALPYNIDTLLDKALGPEGYYGVITTNMHTDHVAPYDQAEAIVASAQAHGVPVVSGRQMLEWLDGRNASTFSGLQWQNGALAFDVNQASGARNLKGMLPTTARVGGGMAPLVSLKRGGFVIPTTVETIKGIEYAFFDATDGQYVADYAPDTTAPAITGVTATPHADGTATVAWTTDDLASSVVAYGTPAIDKQASSAALVTSHTVELTGLTPGATYQFRVSSTNAANLTATDPEGDPYTFQMPVVTAPVLSGVTVTLAPTGTEATLAWATDKPADSRVDFGTNPASLDRSVSASGLVSSHSLVLDSLNTATTYHFRVTSAVAGMSATLPLAPATASFTTPLPGLIDTTVAHFSAGTLDANVAVTQTGDGEVALKGGEGSTEFTDNALPANWTSHNWTGSNGLTFAGGAAVVDGAWIASSYPSLQYGPGTSVEFRAQFTSATFQYAGFGGGNDTALFNDPPFVVIGQGGAAGLIQARINLGSGTTETDLGTVALGLLTGWHTYRIDWTTAGFVFSVDGIVRHSTATPSTTLMRVGASDYTADGATLTLDWVHVLSSAYAPSGTFQSRIFDGGSLMNWGAIRWTALTPAGTAIAISTRTGNSAAPDGTWTAFAPVAASGSTVGGSSRYIQYQAVLTTPDAAATPVLQDVAIGRTTGSDTTAPVITNVVATPAADGTSATVAWTTDEPATSLVAYGIGNLGQQASIGGLATSHSVVLPSLTPGATYQYEIRTTDASSNQATQPGSFTAPSPTAPIVSNWVATPGPTGTTATITWTTDKPADSRVDYGTTAADLSLSLTTGTPTTNHSLVLTSLTPNSTYYYRVRSVAGGLGTTEPATPATFTTPLAGLVDTTVADFSGGTLDANVAVTQTGDGEVALKGTAGSAEFNDNTLPANWTSFNWGGSNGLTFAGGAAVVDGARIASSYPSLQYGPGTSIEFRARFGSAQFQYAGFGAGDDTGGDSGLFGAGPYAVIGQGPGAGVIKARISGTEYDLDPTNSLGLFSDFHTYRIDWTATGFVFSIDGNVIRTENNPISVSMRAAASDYNNGGGVLTLDWVHVLSSSYPPSGTFQSRIFDGGSTMNWGAIRWTALTPAGTAIAISTRTGNSAAPDGTWTAFAPVAASGTTVGGSSRYIQYQAVLTTPDAAATPVLQDVAIDRTAGSDTTAPVITNVAVTPAADGTSATVAWTTDEAATSLVAYGVGNLGQQASIAGLATSHLVVLSPLTPGATYQYEIRTTDASSNQATQPGSFLAPILTAPVISHVTATPNGASATIAWDTDKPATSRVDWGTTAGALSLSVENASLVTSHGFVINGLLPNTTYYYRVTSVADGKTAVDPAVGTYSFATPPPAFIDTTASDFTQGTLDANLAVTQDADGEVALKGPAGSTEFIGTALPADWVSMVNWTGTTGSVSVSGGLMTVDGARASTKVGTEYGVGTALEFVANFGASSYQHVGFAAGDDGIADNVGMFNRSPWAMVSTHDTNGATIKARVWDGGSVNENISLGTLAAGPHRYRIVWNTGSFDFYVDGEATPRVSIAATITTPMRVGASDYNAGVATLAVDWVHVLSYPSSGTFTSRIFDAGSPVNWGAFSWTALTSSGTGVLLATRVGNSPTPDGSWTSFLPAGSSGSGLGKNSRYVQYRAVLTTPSSTATPVLQDVTLAATNGNDTVAPTIVSLSPGSGDTNVPVNSDVTVQFSELMGGSAASAVRLRAVGSSAYLLAATALNGATVTLNPTADLSPGVEYEVSVAATAADLAGNPLGTLATSRFTTAYQVLASFVDTDMTANGFAAGSGTCSVTSGLGAAPDGRVVLPTTASQAFDGTSLPAGWVSTQWTGGAATVSGGLLRIDGARADMGATLYSPGQVFEAVATFGGEPFQTIGFGYELNLLSEPWATFSTTSDASQLYVRTNTGSAMVDTGLSNAYFNSPHTYRIEWTTNQVRFYIDGTLVGSPTVTIAGPMRPVFSDYTNGGSVLTVDSFTLSALPNSCTFTSRVIDAGQQVQWGNVSWTGLPATGTTLSVRTGGSATPDETWTGFASKANGAAVGSTSRYIQYQAALSTSGLTELRDVTFTAAGGSSNHAPVAVPDSYSTPQDAPLTVPAPGVLANDTDADSDPLVALPVAGPSHGTLTLNEDGSFVYTPAPGYAGPDAFSYKASDRLADSNVATVTITVVPASHTLTVTKDGNGQGTVASNPAGINCGAACNANYPSGTSVDLSATAAPGSTFAGWSGACTGTGACLVLLDQPRSVTATFTVTPVATRFTDTTVADFSQGTLGANTRTTTAGDGEVALKLFADEFLGTSLSTEWELSNSGGCTPTATVSGGQVTLSCAHISTLAAPFGPGSFVEFSGTIGAAMYHYAGFTGQRSFAAGPWALFGTQGGSAMVIETSNHPTAGNAPTSISTDASVSHLFRIDWLPTGYFDYYVDGTKAGSSPMAVSAPMWVGAGRYDTAGQSMTLDYLRAGPYSGSYLSRVFAAPVAVASATFSWAADTPAGTTLGLFVRTGSTPNPDASWTAFTAVPTSGQAIAAGWQYIQYRADFATTAAGTIPVLNQVQIDYAAVDVAPPTIVATSPGAGATSVGLDSDVTVQFSEALNPSTVSSAALRLRANGAGDDTLGTVSYSGTTAVLHPSSRLAPNTTYTVTVAGTIADISGNPLGSDVAWAFTTENTPAGWWRGAWPYRLAVTVQNNSSSALPVHYSVKATLDTAQLVSAGQMLANCNDLRAVYSDGILFHELDRIVESCNTSQTVVWFGLQEPIAPSAQTTGYSLYYGNTSAGAPPANGMNVFLFYEDWENGTAHWTSAGGADPEPTGTMGRTLISTEDALSPAHSQKLPQKWSNGDAFSGYIPVEGGTGYAVSAWAKSGTLTYMPVGLDYFDAGHTQLNPTGNHVWLWTNEWSLTPQWTQRSAAFTTPASTAYIKIDNEWWMEAPGTAVVYSDNIALRYAVGTEPAVTVGDTESTLPAPTLSNIAATPNPLQVGGSVTVTADVAATGGTIDQVTLRVLSPEVLNLPMSLTGGTGESGTWSAGFTPTQGGTYTYRVLAHATNTATKISPAQTFTVTDISAPQISLVAITNPIPAKNLQTLTVLVTDNGLLSSVTVEIGGTQYPMTANGSQYSYSWRPTTVGTISYTVRATDTANNTGVLPGSFVVEAREADVCTWKGCKQGAESWSDDDGNTGCKAELEAAGLRGTYYYNGTGTPDWFAQYSAVGHEIASHTAGHPCTTNTCWPNCTLQDFYQQCPFTPDQVTSYRQDQFEPNIAAIEAGTGKPVLTAAWPCGNNDPGRRAAAEPYFVATRGYFDPDHPTNPNYGDTPWTNNINEATPVEWQNLWAGGYYTQSHIDRAASEGKWAIIVSHGDCVGIDYMGQRRDVLWAAPVGEVAKYIRVRDAAVFSNYSRSGHTITFDAAHSLSTFQRTKLGGGSFLPVVYDNPVTLKVHILDTDTVVGVTLDSAPVTDYSVQTVDGARYVLLDAALNAPRHVVVSLGLPAPTIGPITDTTPLELGLPAQVTASVTMVSGGSIQSVTLRVLSPQAADYPMTAGAGDSYSAGFTPLQLGPYTYRVLAANNQGTTAQSAVRTITVVDTTGPQTRDQQQSGAVIAPGAANTLSAQAMDLGGLRSGVLETDESGSWQEFTYPVTNWWNNSWAHRRAVTVTESTGLARAAEIVDLAISGADYPGLGSCTNELRVATQAGTEVVSQVYDEQNVGGVLSCRLLFPASVAAHGSSTYYVYYGNPSATAPVYTSDLQKSGTGVMTITNSYFSLDLDGTASGGVISRVSLPHGSNTNLSLAPQSAPYWGWHQVCSMLDGNITGKNAQCPVGQSGVAPASGLAMTATLDGPLAKEYTFTSEKTNGTYTIRFRFLANSPYYKYTLSRTGGATVQNNFDYPTFCTPQTTGGSCAPFNVGADPSGSPATWFNTYSSGADNVRIASFAPVDYQIIDGYTNGVTTLGGSEYNIPTSSGLTLYVATGATQPDAQTVLAGISAPVVATPAAVENAPVGQYGSPVDLHGSTAWETTTFTWQNAAIPAGQPIHWRVKYCDVSGNCARTAELAFDVRNPNHTLTVTKAGTGLGTVTSSPAGIDCGPTCAADYAQGTTVGLATTPDVSSVWFGWSGNDCVGTGPCSVTMTQPRAVTATFNLKRVGLNVVAPDHGTITTPDGRINCGTGGSACQALYDYGTVVSPAAVPDPNYQLGNWSNACSGNSVCTVTLTAPASLGAVFTMTPPAISISDASVTEGNLGEYPVATVTVSLSHAYDQPVSVGWSTPQDGIGHPATFNDFQNANGTLTFPPGTTSQTIGVVINGDSIYEPDETFSVQLNIAVNATIADGLGRVTILNDDPMPSVSVLGTSIREGRSGTKTVIVLARLSNPSATPVTVDYATSNGTALDGQDYVAKTGTLTFPASDELWVAGGGSQPIEITILGDTTPEPDKAFHVVLSNPTGATLGASQATVTILDNQGLGEPTVEGNWQLVQEGVATAQGAVWAGGQYHLATWNGEVWTSADGSEWQKHVADPLKRTLRGVATDGNGRIVAVGQMDASLQNGPPAAVWSSDNGATWHTGDTSSFSGVTLYGVAYGGGTFVAVGSAGTILTSPDGAVWTSRNTGYLGGRVMGVAYGTPDGTGRFVAVNSARRVATSPDGISWTLAFMPAATVVPNAVAWTGSQFVAVGGLSTGAAARTIFTSPDGVTWTLRDAQTRPLYGVAAGNGVIVAVGDAEATAPTTGQSWTSTDGVTWTLLTLPAVTPGVGTSFRTVAFGGAGFLAAGTSGNVYTTDGATAWADRTPPASRTYFSVAHDGTRYCAVGIRGLSATSLDGTNWTNHAAIDPAAHTWNAVLHANGSFLAVGNAIASSPDCEHWTQWVPTDPLTPGGATSNLAKVAYGNGRYVAVGWNTPPGAPVSPRILTSSDGTTWADATPDLPAGNRAQFAAVAYGAGRFVAFAEDFQNGVHIYLNTSVDGVNWTLQPTTFFDENYEDVSELIYAGGQFVLATDRIWTSPDGINWTLRKNYGDYYRGLSYGNGRYVAVGDTGAMAVSADGATWVPNTSPTRHDLAAVAYAPNSNRVVALGISAIVASGYAPLLSVGDVTVAEGPSGTTNAVFPVTLSAPSDQPVTVQYATADGTATAGTDYTATSGTLTIPAGLTSGSITVPVIGDRTPESDETFQVVLSAPTNAEILVGTATGTILNDTTVFHTLTVTKGGNGQGTVTSSPTGINCGSDCIKDYVEGTLLGFTTTPSADSVFSAWSGGVCVGSGTCAVTMSEDRTVTANFSLKQYMLTVTTPTHGTITTLDGKITCGAGGSACSATYDHGAVVNATATAVTGYALGTWSGACSGSDPCSFTMTGANTLAATFPIIPVQISIGNASVVEGNCGTATLSFPVTLSAASPETVTVHYATANGTATAGSDYVATSGTLTFPPNVSTPQQIVVTVNGDTLFESDETLAVNLDSPTNATIAGGSATGTIANDDVELPPGEEFVTWTHVGGASECGADLTKTQLGGGFDSGAVSTRAIQSGTGYVEFSGPATPVMLMAGLSHGDSSLSYEDIDFAVFFYLDGNAYVYEAGTWKAVLGTYGANDRFRVAVDNGHVVYQKNGDTVYESLVTASYPLLLDTSLASQGASIRSAVIAGTLTDAWPSLPQSDVEWTHMAGAAASGNSLTKTALTSAFDAGAVSTLAIQSGDGYVEFSGAATPQMLMAGLSHGDSSLSYEDIDFAVFFYLDGNAYVYESGAWKTTLGAYGATDRFRVAVEDGKVRYRKNDVALYESLVAPSYPLLLDTSLASSGASVTSAVIAGVSLVEAWPSLPTENVVWTHQAGATGSGSTLTKTAPGGGFDAGAVSTRAIQSGDGYVEFSGTSTPAMLMAGLSHGDSSLSYEDIDFAVFFYLDGNAYVYEAGVWKASLGAYGATDRFRVAVGGGVVSYRKNGVALYESSAAPSYPLVLDTSLASAGSSVGGAQIAGGSLVDAWPALPTQDVQWVSVAGAAASGSTLTKSIPSAAFDAGGVSAQAIQAGNGYVEFSGTSTPQMLMAGLSSGDSGTSYEDIDFAVFLYLDGNAYVYEGGTWKASLGAYGAATRFRVAVEGGKVCYQKDGVALYESQLTPAYPLLLDSSLASTEAAVINAVIAGTQLQ